MKVLQSQRIFVVLSELAGRAIACTIIILYYSILEHLSSFLFTHIQSNDHYELIQT
jgi:hypothetical protein